MANEKYFYPFPLSYAHISHHTNQRKGKIKANELKLTEKSVTFDSEMLIPTVTYPLAATKDYGSIGENNGEKKPKAAIVKSMNRICD